jgi:hypothetical protein
MRVGTETINLPPVGLSHGYQASIAWITDLIGQYFLDVEGKVGTRPSTEHMTGLVLIDEIDLFLHPEWQAQFVQALSDTFPNLQFIATTHSPIVLAGCKRSEVVMLDVDAQGDVFRQPLLDDPRLLTPAELYRRVLGMESTPPWDLADKLERCRMLARDDERSDEEDHELTALLTLLAREEVETRPVPVARTTR